MAYESDIQTIKDAGFNKYLIRTKYGINGIPSDYTSASNLAGGTLGLNTVINIGSNLVRIDGKNNRLIINDGATDRIIIGKLN